MRMLLASLLSATVVLFSIGKGWGAHQLRGADVYPAPNGVQAIALGDFNGDGLPDLVSEGAGPAIMLNAGNGTFSTAQIIYPGASDEGGGIAVGDFNRDGNLDLVVGGSQNIGGDFRGLAVYLGNGDGTFQDPIVLNTQLISSLAVGDFNNDGFPDILFSSPPQSGLGLALNNGDGHSYSIRTIDNARSGPVAVGDFNRDGSLDFGSVNDTDSSVHVYFGDGAGNFPTSTTLTISETTTSTITVGDFDDGNGPDLLVGGIFSFHLFSNHGDGTFAADFAFSIGTGPIMVAVSGDVNGDGVPDLVMADSNGIISKVLNYDFDSPLGDGSFVGAHSVNSLAVADINGDGFVDVVAGGGSFFYEGGSFGTDSVSVLHGLDLAGNDLYAASPVPRARGYPDGVTASSFAVGDFRGVGGVPDIAITEYTLNQVFTTFSYASSYPVGHYPSSVVAGDFDGDNKLDLAVANQGDDNVSILLNGGGYFLTAVNYPAGSAPSYITKGDFNRDGILDLVVANGGNSVSVLLGDGDGSFQPPISYGVGVFPEHAVVADFNGDGWPDIATANNVSETVTVLLNTADGSGSFRLPALATGTGPFPTSLAVADFNGDGIPDLLVGNNNPAASPAVLMMLGGGDGLFGSPTYYPTDFTPWSVAAYDLNGDGILDIVTSNAYAGDVSYLAGRSDGTFAPAINLGAGDAAVGIAIADVNFDGAPDVLVGTTTGFTVLYNSGAVRLTVSSSINPSIYQQIISVIATVAASYPDAGAPQGNVTFLENGQSIGTASLAKGVASLNVSSLAPGKHNLTAQYLGDGFFYPTASSVLTQVVNPATTTTSVTSSPNPSKFGQKVTINATVKPQFGGTPTGKVSFRVGKQILGSATLNQGTGSITTSALPVGADGILALYLGDSNFTSSSGRVAQKVKK